jgi:hypothetical protein
MEAQEEVCPSPHRDFSPPPPPRLEEMPSSTKATSKKRKKLLFPSSPLAVEIKSRRPFTRSSIPKEVVQEHPLPETPVLKEKGKSIDKPMKEKQETPAQKGKGKDTKRPLERKDETSEKGIEKPEKRKDGTSMQEEKETEENPIETEHTTTPPDSQTYKRLIKQLRDARKEITHLKTEEKVHLAQMEELMVGYSHILDLARFAVRKALPLHKQLKNLYRQNRGFQSQNRKLKVELKHFRDEVAQRNLQVLVEASIGDDKPTAKESTTTLKKPTSAKKKKSTEPTEDTLSTRKGMRLSVKMTK